MSKRDDENEKDHGEETIDRKRREVLKKIAGALAAGCAIPLALPLDARAYQYFSYFEMRYVSYSRYFSYNSYNSMKYWSYFTSYSSYYTSYVSYSSPYQSNSSNSGYNSTYTTYRNTYTSLSTPPPPSPSGAKVLKVLSESAAEKAGIRPDDLILQYGDDEISSVSQLIAAIQKNKNQSSVQVAVTRNGVRSVFKVKGGLLGVKLN